MNILIPDDGLRSGRAGIRGTNKRYPCGHARTAANTAPHYDSGRCRLCKRRIERESYARRKDAA